MSLNGSDILNELEEALKRFDDIQMSTLTFKIIKGCKYLLREREILIAKLEELEGKLL